MTSDEKAKYFEYGSQILLEEGEALLKLSSHLPKCFPEIIQRILECPEHGRVVVSGMGKPSFVGMKLSATLASTGTPSYFLHPAEAMHGDFGRFVPGDIALLLSNSGETEELLQMVPVIRDIGCSIIAITGTTENSLARVADLTLPIGEIVEAGPIGLAPTTSTTVMLALGDAIAMTLVKARAFSQTQFARFHPGGKLGKMLRPVQDIMRKGERHCIVGEREKVRAVVQCYSATPGRPGAASVVDENGKLSGIFTDGDLRRHLEHGFEFFDEPVSEVMGKNPKVITPTQLVSEALHCFTEFSIDQLVVVDEDGKPVGIVDIQDVI